MYALGKHAHAAGIRPTSRTREISAPFIAIAAITLIVAAGVTAWESLVTDKVDFDGNSYCLNVWSFWTAHLSLLGLSLAVAAPLATGWYVGRSDHIPQLQAAKYRWGVGGYVSLLETWSFIGTLLTGMIAAYWIRQLADAPTSSAKIQVFLGFGALGTTCLILGRFVANAFKIRRAYKAELESRANWKDLPPDPTAGFLGEPWKVPAAFAAAFAITFKLLEGANVGRLIGP
jgi:hypothetical protein